MATGVLPVFLGKATKLIFLFNQLDKEYRATLHLGISTDTLDAEGTIIDKKKTDHLSEEQVIEAAMRYRGTYVQRVPEYSAVKIQGVPSYKLARQGKEVPRKQREVTISELTLEAIELPRVEIRMRCTSGTYVRALARDIGESLGVGAHLVQLERLACGDEFQLADSWTVETLQELYERQEALPSMDLLQVLKNLITLPLESRFIQRLQHGQPIPVTAACLDMALAGQAVGRWAKAVGQDDEVIAVGQLQRSDDEIRFFPTKLLI